MTTATNLLFFSCFVTLFHNFPVLSLSCAVCSYVDPGCQSGNVLPSPCPTGARDCFTLRLFISGRQGIFRGCKTSPNTSEGCHRTNVGSSNALACYSLCDWEGCNSLHGNALANTNTR